MPSTGKVRRTSHETILLPKVEEKVLVTVPLIYWALVFFTFYKRSHWFNIPPSWRNSFLLASTVFGVLVTLITESLSVRKLFSFNWVLGTWGLVGALTAGVICLVGVSKRRSVDTPQGEPLVHHAMPLSSKLLLLGVAFIVAVVGVIALVAPSNNHDSMVYHMSRVVHWIQNQGVGNYPTNIIRQLYMNPWAEFAILHLQILTHGDRYANLVQWFSMIGSLVGVTLIAEQLGTSLQGQVFAAVVCVTIPMGILQSSSTQTDYAAAFWLVCFVTFGLLLTTTWHWIYLVATGCALGLAILTKATVYLYAPPFCVWFGLKWFKILRWRLWKPVVLIAVVVLSINLGHYKRNLDLSMSHIGVHVNEAIGPSVFISNVVRNIALHTQPVRDQAESGVHLLHDLLRIDVNDKKTSWQRFSIPRESRHEDTAGNPIHLLLIFATVGVWLIDKLSSKRSLIDSSEFSKYVVALLCAFSLSCLFLKWQPWGSRLHLPLFVLWSPLIALVMDKIPNRGFANVTAFSLLLLSLPWVFLSQNRPLISRDSILNTSRVDMYFYNRPDLRAPYINAANSVTRCECRHIGLSTGSNDWEYPFWVLLRENWPLYIQHIDVNNESATLSGNFAPCVVICVQCSRDRIQRYTESLGAAIQLGPVYVFSRGLSASPCGISLSFDSAFYDVEAHDNHWWSWMCNDGQVSLDNPWEHDVKVDVHFTSWSLARERALQISQNGESLAELTVPIDPPESFSLPNVTLKPGQNTLTFSAYPKAEMIGSVLHSGDLRNASIALSDVTLSRCRHTSLPPTARPLGTDFSGQIKLLGYAMCPESGSVFPRGKPCVALYWQALAEMDQDYTVFVHLVDQADHLYSQHDGQPAAGLYPTSEWKEGEVIEDVHLLEVPADIPAGRYSLRVGMYLLSTMERLQVSSGTMQADHSILGPIEVLPNAR